MELQPYVDNDFYIKESKDMITIVQSMIIAGNYQLLSYMHSKDKNQVLLSHTHTHSIMIVATYFVIKHRCFDDDDDDCIRLSLFFLQ